MAAELEASSMGEVVRRAVMALDMFNVTVNKPKENDSSDGERTVRMHVRVSRKTKQKIEELREDYGISTVEVINLALSTLYKLLQIKSEAAVGRTNERIRIAPMANESSLVMAALA